MIRLAYWFVTCLSVGFPSLTSAQVFDSRRVTTRVTDEDRQRLRETMRTTSAEIASQRAEQLDAIANGFSREAALQTDAERRAVLLWKADSVRMEASHVRDPASPRPRARIMAARSAPTDQRVGFSDRRDDSSSSDDASLDRSGGHAPMNRIPQATPQGTAAARIMVFMTTNTHGAVSVSIDNTVEGGLVHSLAPGQECAADGAVTMTVRPGTHRLFAQSTRLGNEVTWGPVDRTVAAGQCYVWRLDERSQSHAGAKATNQSNAANEVTVVFWTRRSLESEGISVQVDGDNLTPANWSFTSNPTDCKRMPAYAARDYSDGATFVVQTRATLRRDMNRPLLTSRNVTLPPGLACYFYEVR
jgi:hypothetical protein